jgi:hypothetical protein
MSAPRIISTRNRAAIPQCCSRPMNGSHTANSVDTELAEGFAAEAAAHFNEGGKMFEVRIWEEED